MESKFFCLKDQFIEDCIQLSEYIQNNKVEKYNKLYDEQYAYIKNTIIGDTAFGKEVLIPLLSHDHDYVKKFAAEYCIIYNIDVEQGVAVLKKLKAESEDKLLRMRIRGYLLLYNQKQLPFQK